MATSKPEQEHILPSEAGEAADAIMAGADILTINEIENTVITQEHIPTRDESAIAVLRIISGLIPFMTMAALTTILRPDFFPTVTDQQTSQPALITAALWGTIGMTVIEIGENYLREQETLSKVKQLQQLQALISENANDQQSDQEIENLVKVNQLDSALIQLLNLLYNGSRAATVLYFMCVVSTNFELLQTKPLDSLFLVLAPLLLTLFSVSYLNQLKLKYRHKVRKYFEGKAREMREKTSRETTDRNTDQLKLSYDTEEDQGNLFSDNDYQVRKY